MRKPDSKFQYIQQAPYWYLVACTPHIWKSGGTKIFFRSLRSRILFCTRHLKIRGAALGRDHSPLTKHVTINSVVLAVIKQILKWCFHIVITITRPMHLHTIQQLSYDDHLKDERADYQNCSALYCTPQLFYPVIWEVLTDELGLVYWFTLLFWLHLPVSRWTSSVECDLAVNLAGHQCSEHHNNICLSLVLRVQGATI